MTSHLLRDRLPQLAAVLVSILLMGALLRTGSMTAEDMLTGVNSTYINSVTVSGSDIIVDGATSELDFTLIYGLNGAVAMVPVLDITNTTAAQLDIDLFNYQNWDVNGTAGRDTLDWNGVVATVSQGGTGDRGEPSNAPHAAGASGWPTPRNNLRDGGPTTLTDGAGLPFGPGDGTFAFQLALSLALGETATVIYSVPEPSTGMLGGLGLAGLAWASRRRRI